MTVVAFRAILTVGLCLFFALASSAQDHAAAVQHYQRAMALYGAHDVQGAITELTRAVELDARYAEAWNDLGVIQRQQGKLKTSIECFHKAIDAKPRFESARYNLALAFEASHDFDAALKQARNVIALAPRIPQAHALCGRLLMEQNRLERLGMN